MSSGEADAIRHENSYMRLLKVLPEHQWVLLDQLERDIREDERSATKDVVSPQPHPLAGTSEPIWDLVVGDMIRRDQIGRERYGTPLQIFNGRDALVDAYQEALDLVVYLRQAIEERNVVATADDPTQQDYDPGPEADDEGGMSEHRQQYAPPADPVG